jgi:predicted amidohydrolase YtcJ
VNEVLNFIEEMRNTNPLWDRRVRLEHIQHVQDKDLYRFKMLDVISSVQPAHLFFDAKIAAINIDKPETTHIFKKLIDKGNRVCFGTDFPVVMENPFENIYFAMTREAIGYPEGYNTEMCLDLVTCLEAYTINNAYASYEENKKGSIKTDKAADLIVLDRDIFKVDVKDIKNAVVESTFINGINVHSM